MRNVTRTTAVLTPLLVLVSGCFSLSRQTPVLEQYVLGGASAVQMAASPRDLAGLTIGVRRLDLAPYLAVPEIVVRRGAHQIVVSSFHRWAEDPAEGINRAVARYVAAGAPVRAVDVAPWSAGSHHDYLVQLHISRFEGVVQDSAATEGEVHMAAAWEISRQQDGAVLARGATEYRERGWRVGDYAGLVTLLDRGLNGLARDVATCLARLVTVATPAEGITGPVTDRGGALVCDRRSQ